MISDGYVSMRSEYVSTARKYIIEIDVPSRPIKRRFMAGKRAVGSEWLTAIE
jgi:hypothetical protein